MENNSDLILPGNVLNISVSKEPIVKWIGNDTLKIAIIGLLEQSFEIDQAKSKYWNGIFIQISINKNTKRNNP